MNQKEIDLMFSEHFKYGVRKKKIHLYEKEILLNAKNYDFLNIPLDIILMSKIIVSIFNDEITQILSLVIEDSEIFEANLLSLVNQENSKSMFLVHNDNVYDVSRGCRIEKDYYFNIQRPIDIIKKNYTISNYEIHLEDIFIKIMKNIKKVNIDRFYTIYNDVLQMNEPFSSVENRTAILLNIIKKFSNYTIYPKELKKSIREFEATCKLNNNDQERYKK